MDDDIIGPVLERLSEEERNPEAWAALYHAVYPFIFASLFRIFRGNVFFVEEAVQETLLRILKYYKFDSTNSGPATFTAYLKIVLESVARDLLRHQRRTPEITGVLDTVYAQHSAFFESPETAANARLEISSALRSLSDRDEVIARSLLAGQSVEELARELSVTIKTAYNLSSLVKRKLRTHLGLGSGKTV